VIAGDDHSAGPTRAPRGSRPTTLPCDYKGFNPSLGPAACQPCNC